MALDAAGESAPSLVVAHSFGGVFARMFASHAPSDQRVEALVMLDTYEPDIGMVDDPSLTEDVRAEIRDSLDGTARMLASGESLDWTATFEQLRASGPVMTTAILLRQDPDAIYAGREPAQKAALVDSWYRHLAKLYPNGVVEVVPNAGHFIHLDRPDLVLDRVRALVTSLRQP